MSFFIEIAIFFVLVILALLLFFIIIRISTKTTEKITLLETLVDQQDYQIELLRKICVSLGQNLSDDSQSSVGLNDKYNNTPSANTFGMNESQISSQQIFAPVNQEDRDNTTPNDSILEEVENIKIIAKR